MLRVLIFSLISISNCEKQICEIDACDSLKEGKSFVEEYGHQLIENVTEAIFSKLERRIRSLEQPVWSLSRENNRWTECSEGPCECIPETKTMNCWQLNIPSLPFEQIIPHDTLVIDLGINKLTTLHKDAFKHLLFLSELDLFDNELDYLPETLFDDLENLKYLRLHKNFLTDLPNNSFWGIRNMKSLDLSLNRLRHLPEDIFSVCRDMVMLYLSGNKLQELPENLLSDMKFLEDLDFSKNQLKELPLLIFKDLFSLKRLNLAENELTELQDELFGNLRNLEYLNLRKNKILNISGKLLNAMQNLQILQLASNRIGESLLYVKENYGNLVKLPSFHEYNTRNPQVLLLPIHRTAKCESSPTYKGIKLSSETFKDLTELTELNLGQNYILDLPEEIFSQNGKLRKLILYSNSLTELKEKCLVGLEKLSTLLMNNNLLENLHPNLFIHAPNIEKLHLDSNKFRFLQPRTLDSLKNITSIKLTKNQWHCDCNILYLALWVSDNNNKLWDSQPSCRGPGDLSGELLKNMRFQHLCDGQWASMMNLAPRVPVKHKSEDQIET